MPVTTERQGTDYEILISYEEERFCGFRHSGPDGVGIYLRGGAYFEPCERLPYPLTTCPTCGAGVHFSRGYTWIDPTKLFEPTIGNPCSHAGDHMHAICPMCNPAEAVGNLAGLLWVGQKSYSPFAFMGEALTKGISRRLPAIPRGFEIGRHIIYLAHVQAVALTNEDDEIAYAPGIFMTFKPTSVDLVVDVDDVSELPERAIHLKDRLGEFAKIIKVVPSGEMSREAQYDSEEE